MLRLPKLGVNRSVTAHRVNVEVLAEWIEASLLFTETERISRSDVVDVLLEDHVYDDSDFCHERLDDVWLELRRRRANALEGSGFLVLAREVQRTQVWREIPMKAFCVFLSLGIAYEKWAKGLGPDYNAQGSLFEQCTAAAMRRLFPEWGVIETGWTPENARKIDEVAKAIAGELSLGERPVEAWAAGEANEGGVDLVLHRTFPDQGPGRPVILTQCASGVRWSEKRSEPNLRRWGELIVFVSQPQRGFAVPFSLSETELKETSMIVDGLVLDRGRLLSHKEEGESWIDERLRGALTAWLAERVDKLTTDGTVGVLK